MTLFSVTLFINNRIGLGIRGGFRVTFCGKCGYNNPEESMFCVNCGADLKESIGTERAPEEVERIGAYDPNKTYPAAQVPPQQPVQQPPMQAYPLQPPQTRVRPRLTAPTNYNPKGRGFGIILSVVSLIVTIVSLFAIPANFATFDTTFLRIGMMEGETTILIMTFVTLAIAIVALLEPIFSIGSGICLIITAYLVYSEEIFKILSLGTPGFIVFILLAIDIIVLGFVAMVFMRKFVNNNIKGINMFKACYLAWTGIPHM